MSMYHDGPHAGHLGVDKTLELLKRKFCWKSMRVDVEDYVCTNLAYAITEASQWIGSPDFTNRTQGRVFGTPF
jgi:Integrase zinc binding domain